MYILRHLMLTLILPFNVYIIDLSRRRLVGWQWDKTNRRLTQMGSRNLRTDFKRAEDEQPEDNGQRPGRRPSRGGRRGY